jgi:hypothetical protein
MRGDKFHDHLALCGQCNQNPWALCDLGEHLLKEAAAELRDRAEIGNPLKETSAAFPPTPTPNPPSR